MDHYSGISKEEDEQIDLPPGFRFHPTDEELITHYLSQKVLNSSFNAIAIGEADFNKVEPWDLPSKAKMGEKEWYFFSVRDRKYPTGQRTNRATEAGYWKATGKDKEIFRGKILIGMKKTLVFYTGRAPKGEKSNWVIHEYRLDGKYSEHNLPKTAKKEWVISRVFNKSSGGKKPNLDEFMSVEELQPTFLPPLMDSSPYNRETNCFSSPLMAENILMEPNMANFQYSDSILMEDESILKLLVEEKGTGMTPSSMVELSRETGLSGGDNMNNDHRMLSAISNHEIVQNPDGPIDLDCLWNY